MEHICIGIYVHSEFDRLHATLVNLRKNTAHTVEILILPDGQDDAIRISLASLDELPQLSALKSSSIPACFNSLAASTDASVLVLLESGAIVGSGWLDNLLTAFGSDPHNGIAGPSTNWSWNEQCVFPHSGGTPAEIAYTAQEAEKRFGKIIRTLDPLHSLADFCYVVRREVVEAIGAADEGYGFGPCWEMDYNIRAARAGYRGIWVCSAYVHRTPFIPQRRRDEALLFENSKHRYQNKFCRLKLETKRSQYCSHCVGEACQYFAPKDLIQIRLPISKSEKHIPKKVQPAICLEKSDIKSPAYNTEYSIEELPLVSCIMPTYNRRPFVSRAIEYFIKQDYPNRELIIVDDGTDPIKDLVPEDTRIRYLRKNNKCTIGAKRNLACTEAKGEIIVHWDDDDWMATWRLSYQVENLLKEKADICGLNKLLFYDQKSNQSWQYIYPERDRQWLAGGTFCYTRSLWNKNPFPDINIGEDTRFLWNNNPKKMITLQNNTFYVAMIHSGGTSPKRTTDIRWHPYPTREIQDIMGKDWTLCTNQDVQASRDLPMVSCIMPTYNRRLFVPQAIKYFLSQDYPNKELVIVDDGTDNVADLIPNNEQIKYIHLDQKASIGYKRNLAVKESKGEIIAHWDDDDLYRPSYLKNSIHRLLQSRGRQVISGLAVYLTYILEDSALKICRTGRIAGATFCYFKTLWEKNPYRDVHSAEDYFFLEDTKPSFVFVEEPELFVVIRHKYHTWHQERGIDINTYLRQQRDYSKCLDEIINRDDYQFYEMVKQKLYQKPLVSCIMPTHNRRLFVSQAIKYFLRQDYPNKELVIVDDGTDRVIDIVPNDEQIKYIHLDREVSIGYMRNLAVEQSKGRIIAHWDDDDWYSENRISYQVQPLLEGKAEICGIDTGFIYHIPKNSFWSLNPNLHSRMFYSDIHGGSIVYTRYLWEKYAKYPDIYCGEDVFFLKSISQKAKLVKLPNKNVFIYIRHDTNIWKFICGKSIDPGGWRSIRAPAFLPPEDFEFYQRFKLAQGMLKNQVS